MDAIDLAFPLHIHNIDPLKDKKPTDVLSENNERTCRQLNLLLEVGRINIFVYNL